MTRIHCKRSWEVEALEDGRLEEKDRASLERHAETCADCAQALVRRRELDTLLVGLPAPERTELDRRRARGDLLARANDGMFGEVRPRRRMIFALVPALVALVLVVFAIQRRAPVPAPAPVAAATSAPLFEVASVDAADFTLERVGEVSRVTLRSGTASFHVEHVKPGARFLVALPDGEVEVRGTRFVVEVVGGSTRSVAVTEGVVAVHIGGFDGVLRAGERWPFVSAAATAPAAPSSAPPLAATPPSAPAASSAVAPARPLVGRRFAEAMSAFSAGDYGEADRLFVAFANDFPTDTHTEDAMFLLADARARRGDSASARDAARAYLRRFPNGLRAPAAARLAGDPPSAAPR